MSQTDEIKVLDDRIKADQTQYNLDREAAKISALSTGILEKYEYLTGEDLGYKPGVVEAKNSNVFNKGIKEDDRKERLLKRLKNIEDKNEKQLDEIEHQGERQLDMVNN